MTHREEIWNKAYKRIFELYGENPNLNIVNRFLSEKAALSHYGIAEYFEELSRVCTESIDKYNEKLVVKAPVASCLTAYLLGASDIDPIAHNLPYESYIPYAQALHTKSDDIVRENFAKITDLLTEITKKHFQFSMIGAARAVHLLGQETGVSPDEIDLSDCDVKHRLLGGDFSCGSPKLAMFLKTAYETVQPSNYDELLKLIGMAHGTQTWRNNAEDLLMNGKCRLADIPATRDEVFILIRDAMREHGVYDTGFVYDVSNKVRKGFYAENGMDGYTIDTLKSLGFDDWFASYLLGVRYMSTKALAILELRYIIMLTYFKCFHPEEYKEVLAGEDIW